MMSTIHSEKEKTLIYSCITSLNVYKGFSVLRTCNVNETADLLRGMVLKMDKNKKEKKEPCFIHKEDIIDSIEPTSSSYVSVVKKVKKENITSENIGEIMLCQIPGISNNTSKIVMDQYKTIRHLLQCLVTDPTCLDQLTYELKGKVRKVNSTSIKNIKKYLLDS